MAADLYPATVAPPAWADVTENLAYDVNANSLASSDDELPHLDVLPAVSDAAAATAVTDALMGGLAAAFSPLTSIPALNSLAGATASLYLDFNGHFDSVWGAHRNITTPAFDQDGDVTTFSDGELTTIRNIWAQVSEDFAPFKINVTTVEPASFGNGVAMRVAIGGDGNWLGGEAGGVGYIDSFTNSVVNTVYVFPKQLANGYFKYVAEATSHEVGHGFGLEHQSLFSSTGTLQQEYYSGAGGIAPIMGNSYSTTRGLWWNGTNGDRVRQDDMSVIARAANGFGYRADDYGNSVATAKAFAAVDGRVSASGIIHQTTDVDYFSFATGAGQVSFTVSVPAGINNLDTRLELRSATGTVIASAAPTTSFGASITRSLAAGTYYVVVASQGKYGEVGQYTVSGTIVPVAISTVAAPSGLTATAVSGTQVNLTWSNVSGETGYKIERLAGGVWTQIGTTAADVISFQDTTAIAGTGYQYRVRATNAGGDSEYSNLASVTTPNVVSRPVAPSSLTASINANRQVQLAWRDNSTNETVFVVQRSTNGYSWTTLGSVPANSTGAIDTSAARGRVYYYRVFAYNSAGYSSASNSARVVTPNLAARTTTRITTASAPTIQKWTGQAPTTTKSSFRQLPSRGAVKAAQPVFAFTSSQSAKYSTASSPSSEWSTSVDALFGTLGR